MSKATGPDRRSIFDLTPEEAEQRLQPRLEELKKELFDNGLPITYQDARCPTEDHYVQEYEDGRVHLAVLDEETREFKFVKDISNG